MVAMTTTPVTTVTATLEPAKRIIRTVVALIIAIASVLPYFIGHTHFDSATITGALTQLGAVAAAVTAFGATPAGNFLYGLVGLNATAVAKLSTDIQNGGEAIVPVVETVVDAIPVVRADGAAVVSDVKDIINPPAE